MIISLIFIFSKRPELTEFILEVSILRIKKLGIVYHYLYFSELNHYEEVS